MNATRLLAAHAWPDNAALIADIAAHGRYLWDDAEVLDTTYGHGNFWTRWRPQHLTAHDLNPAKAPDGPADCRRLPHLDQAFDVVVFDPPYKLNGTEQSFDDADRYGVNEPATWQERMALIEIGTMEACRVAHRFVLVKCQDQVASGAIRWQTDLITAAGERVGFRKVDRFDLLGHSRPQDVEDRSQQHAHGRPSTLIVLGHRKPAKRNRHQPVLPLGVAT